MKLGRRSESASRHLQPGEGPSRGLLRDCTTSPINRLAALQQTHPSHGINFGQQWGQDQPSPDQCRSGSSQCPHQWEIVFKSALTSFTRLHSETELLNPPDLFALSKENRKIEFPSFVKCSYVQSTSFHTFTK